MTTGLWSLTSYIITSTIFLLPAGRWSDLAGRKKIFMNGLVLFTIATFLCGVAPSGVLLLIFRFIQGAGAALSLATATPIIVRAFPPQSWDGRSASIPLHGSWVPSSVLMAEASLPPATASKVFLGTSGILNPTMQGALIHATDAGFWVFVGFYLLALMLALPLLRPYNASHREDRCHRDIMT